MILAPLTFSADNETLSGCLVLATSSSRPTVLFLHGAGQANMKRALPLAEQLAARHGLSSFLFDFSGHGASSGTIQNSSLEKRTREAEAAIHAAKLAPSFSICAFSMGGHVALTLIDTYRISSLNLFYPAVYPADAEIIPFGPGFSAAIRKEGAWRESRRFESLQRFEGRLLVTIGDRDEVIPSDLPQSLIDSATNAISTELVIVPGGTHSLLPEIYGSQALFDEVALKICANASPYRGTE